MGERYKREREKLIYNISSYVSLQCIIVKMKRWFRVMLLADFPWDSRIDLAGIVDWQ